jgi:hypothetical protein
MGSPPGLETPITPDGPGDSTLVMGWKGCGGGLGDGFVECDGLFVDAGSIWVIFGPN